MNCPKCGTKYHCPCSSCKGEGWKWHEDDNIECLTCNLKRNCDWWFNLECDIYREDMREIHDPLLKSTPTNPDTK